MVFLVLPVAALTLGAWALQPLALKRDSVGLLARLCTGLVLCGLAILVLGAIALPLAKWAIILIAGTGLTYEVFFRRKHPPVKPSPEVEPTERRYGFLFWMGLGTACLGVLLALVASLSPAADLEAVSGPLAAAKDYENLGRLAPYDGADAPSYTSLAQCLYAWACTTGTEADARLMSWLFTLFAAVGLYALARQLAGPCGGAVAAGAFAGTPLFLNRAAAVSGDMLAAGFVLVALAALLVWQKERRLAWLVLAGYSREARGTGARWQRSCAVAPWFWSSASRSTNARAAP